MTDLVQKMCLYFRSVYEAQKKIMLEQIQTYSGYIDVFQSENLYKTDCQLLF